jgi:heme A synthase
MSSAAPKYRRFARYAWFVLAYNLLVILWGAVVRATGSGAGCGEHWPLCQGVMIPHGAQIATLIEFAHRASSGVAVILVIGLAHWAFRSFAPSHTARRYALAALCFTLIEGLIGAALVLFGWTGNNVSTARFIVLAVHLTNTFLLLASLALTARSSRSAGAGRLEAEPQSYGSSLSDGALFRSHLAYGAALLGTLALALTGTVAALGDSLFPAASLAQGLSWDFSGTPSPVLRLRIIHPLLAVIVGALLLALAVRVLSLPRPSPELAAARRLARCLCGLVLLQAALGALNLLLLAPVVVQVLHLLVADLVWIALVLLAAELLAPRQVPRAQPSPAQPPLAAASVGASPASAWRGSQNTRQDCSGALRAPKTG